MLEGFKPVRFGVGDLVFQEGQPAGALYMVESGQVEIFKEVNGTVMKLAQKGPGEIFGEMAMADSAPRSATAMALEETWCYMLSPDEFRKHLEKMSPFVLRVFQTMATTIRDLNEERKQLRRKSGMGAENDRW